MKKHFAYFYDQISDKSEAKQRANKILKLLRRHNPKSTSVLELGVGNGNVLCNFPKKYDLNGLDIHKEYVALAQKKTPKAKLWTSSMHNFKSKDNYDLIFSIFDSINFLTNFNLWKQTFKTVYNHLNNDGLFIFDMYSSKVLEINKKSDMSFWQEKFGYAYSQPLVKSNNLIWNFGIFEKKTKDKYELHKYQFKERIFSPNIVEKELRKHFKIIEKLDFETLSKNTKNSLRYLYVARKK